MKKKDNLIKIILFTILIIIALSVILLINMLNSDVLEEHNFYAYYGRQKYAYNGALKITKKNGITELICKDIQIELDSTPVYFADTANKVIFPKNMAAIFPLKNGNLYKVNNFSKMYRDNDYIYLEKDGRTKFMQNVFLFDGNNLYFFTEHTRIIVEGKEYLVSPLSYARVIYGRSVEIYNQSTDEYTMIETEDVNIVAKTDSYEIDMSIDALTVNEKRQLLLNVVNGLQNIEME